MESARRHLRLAGVLLAVLAFPQVTLAAGPLTPAQSAESLCGPLCLTFCAKWLGVEADLSKVALAAHTDPLEGTSFAGLKEAAAGLGLEGRCYRLGLADLRRVTASTPAIAHVDGYHFVVAWMETPDEVTMVQPPFAVRRTGLRSFGRRWDGALLVLSRPGGQPSFGWPLLARIALGAEAAAALGLAIALIRRRTRAAPQ
jgi:ABC-type bacteriocin/lantibiotic exporter with double-glycine peptidase domain